MHSFSYFRPASITEATNLLAGGEDRKLLAGGQTLLPTLKQRLAHPTALVDLKSIPGFATIRHEADVVVIGALTRHAEVAASELVTGAIPALAKLAGGIGDVQVRNRGTLGGSIANSDPAADYPAGLLGLGATIGTDRRAIPADDFFTGLFETALQPDEIVTQVYFPIPKRAAYVKFANQASRYAIAGVFVSDGPAGIRVAVTGAGPHAFRLPDFERALERSFAPASLAPLTVSPDGLNTDLHASAEYRAHLIGVLARRAIAAAIA
ncbi:MAG TPA: xanthine dehydrogenase family protein subunit M [Stellaceae bacterium]|nr:xanthine dehydrogenase family protein subunit M [Stellaceae bacterium]